MRTEKIVTWTRGPDVLDVGCAGHKIEIGSPYWLHGRLRAVLRCLPLRFRANGMLFVLEDSCAAL